MSVLNPESPSAKIFNAAEDHALKDFIDPYTPIDHLNTMIRKIESLKTRIVRLATIKPRRWHDSYRFKFRDAIDSSQEFLSLEMDKTVEQIIEEEKKRQLEKMQRIETVFRSFKDEV